jgi:hypothetical protein
MNPDSFCVTLTSNACLDLHPENRPAKYIAELATTRELNGEWEVGLRQIQFTNNWPNTRKSYSFIAWIGVDVPQSLHTRYSGIAEYISLTRNLGEEDLQHIEKAKQLRWTDENKYMLNEMMRAAITVVGPWNSVEELGRSVASAIETTFGTVPMSGSNKVEYVSSHPTIVSPEFLLKHETGKHFLGMTAYSPQSKELFRILGIPMRTDLDVNSKASDVTPYQFFPKYRKECFSGFLSPETAFVYTSVCEEQLINGGYGNLLKLVPISSNKNERQCMEYDNPTFVRVKPKKLRTIEISIRDETGKELEIEKSRSITTVQLHFRKCLASGWC